MNIEKFTLNKTKVLLAAEFIFENNIVQNFGTGTGSKSTEVCLLQQKLIEIKFDIDHDEFSSAFKIAESIKQN